VPVGPINSVLGRSFRSTTQFRAAPYRLRTATHRLPISSCGAAAKVAPHFHKAAALTCWGRSHSRIAAYLHGIRSFRICFKSNAVAVSPLVMHISATTVNDRIIRAPRHCRAPTFCSLDLTSVAIKAPVRAEAEGNRDGSDSFYCGWGVPSRSQTLTSLPSREEPKFAAVQMSSQVSKFSSGSMTGSPRRTYSSVTPYQGAGLPALHGDGNSKERNRNRNNNKECEANFAPHKPRVALRRPSSH